MVSWITAISGLLVVFACAASAAPARTRAGADFYVSPKGRDAWSGTLPGPNRAGTDGPFATLDRARDAVRRLKPLRGRVHPITVLVRGGEYRLTKPFVLQPRDSGNPMCPIVYAAYPGEQPIFTGGRRLTGWRHAGGGLWTVHLPEIEAGKRTIRQLFVNGVRRERARYPHVGWVTADGAANRKEVGWAGALHGESDDEMAKRSFRYRPGDIRADWTNLDDVEVVVLQYWMAPRLCIQSIDEAHRSVLFTGGSFRPLTWSFGYYVDNVYEGIDAPGSWYLNRKTGVLTYHALPGEDLAAAEVVAPDTPQLVRIEGSADRKRFVRNVTLRGLTFRHTSWDLPAQGYYFTQAELPPPAAIQATGAVHCSIEACELSCLGGWAIELGRGCQENHVANCTVKDVGAGCIKIGEPNEPGADVAEARRNEVADNRFLDGCAVYLGAPAVWIGQSGGNTVSHNEIAGQFMWAVSVGWNWEYFPMNRSRDNVVEKNHIHDLGTGVLGTHGALYCLGVSPGTILRGNYIHDVNAAEAWGAGEGIILDNGCVGILVENNVVHDAVAGGWGCNFNCLGNIIQNNVFVNGTRYQLTRYGDAPPGPPPPNGEVFSRNIVMWEKGPLFNEKDWHSFATLWDYNLYWQSTGEPFKFMRFSFDEWKAKGLDAHSVVADPLFVDPSQHDYRLRAGSPALKLGFKPIDQRDVGPRKKLWRK